MYARPGTVEEAARAMAVPGALALAGGTDVYPAHAGKPLSVPLVDLSRVQGLRGISEVDGVIRFGAATTWSDIIKADLPPAFDGLKAAAREVGGVQIQNVGTLCGNVCNASPAADGVPNLMAMDARVELRSLGGTREVPIDAFVLGNRRTARAADELVTALRVPRPPRPARGGFAKLGARRYLVISIVMSACVVEVADGRVAAARIAVGACAPVARRLPRLEARLAGHPLGVAPPAIEAADLAPLAPIDDVRGSAAYRGDAVATQLQRLIGEMLS